MASAHTAHILPLPSAPVPSTTPWSLRYRHTTARQTAETPLNKHKALCREQGRNLDLEELQPICPSSATNRTRLLSCE